MQFQTTIKLHALIGGFGVPLQPLCGRLDVSPELYTFNFYTLTLWCNTKNNLICFISGSSTLRDHVETVWNHTRMNNTSIFRLSSKDVKFL